MLTVGLTGGIGAGKSLISRILQSMGYPVFNSDLEAKNITRNHPKVRAELLSAFGDDLYIGEELDRAKLAAIIFTDPQARSYVNELIHPLVREEFAKWAKASSSPVIFNEAAILFETGSWKNFDRVALVTAPEEIRVQRVINRDKTQREEVIARMRQQWSDEQKIPLAHYVIVNDDHTPVLQQLEKMLQDLIHYSTSS